MTNGDDIGLKLPRDAAKATSLLKKMRDGMDGFEKSFMRESMRRRPRGRQLSEAKSEGDAAGKTEDSMPAKLLKMAREQIARFGVSKAGDWLDELLVGQLKDSLAKIYQDKLDGMDDK